MVVLSSFFSLSLVCLHSLSFHESLSESSASALLAGAGTFPPTHPRVYSVDTVEVATLEGTGCDGSDAGGMTPSAVCLPANSGVASDLLVWCIRIKIVTWVELPTCTPPLVWILPPSLDHSASA